MSLVENIISQITSNATGVSKPSGFDLNDDTFAKLLEKQLNSITDDNSANMISNLGAPAGFMIEPMDGVEFADTAQDQLEAVGENKLTNDTKIVEPFVMKDLDLGDYFSNLLKTSTDSNSGFMNFARKQASGAYNLFGKTFVSNLTEFVEDVASAV